MVSIVPKKIDYDYEAGEEYIEPVPEETKESEYSYYSETGEELESSSSSSEYESPINREMLESMGLDDYAIEEIMAELKNHKISSEDVELP